MKTATKKSIATLAKFVFWTAVAAGLQKLIEVVGNVGIPDIYVPIVAAVLKAAATYVATEIKECNIP